MISVTSQAMSSKLVKQDCEERRRWRLSSKEPAAVAVGAAVDATSTDKCLCSVPLSGVLLPRVFVGVQSDESDDWQRAWAVIDTGPSHRLVCQWYIDRYDIRVQEVIDFGLMALNGDMLSVTGLVSLPLCLKDGPEYTYFPDVCMNVFVVPTLPLINADLVLGGSDMIAKVGDCYFSVLKMVRCRALFLRTVTQNF